MPGSCFGPFGDTPNYDNRVSSRVLPSRFPVSWRTGGRDFRCFPATFELQPFPCQAAALAHLGAHQIRLPSILWSFKFRLRVFQVFAQCGQRRLERDDSGARDVKPKRRRDDSGSVLAPKLRPFWPVCRGSQSHFNGSALARRRTLRMRPCVCVKRVRANVTN